MPQAWGWLSWAQLMAGDTQAGILSAERTLRLDEARDAIVAGRRASPDLSLESVQDMYGVSRPAVDARRNEFLRQAGLE